MSSDNSIEFDRETGSSDDLALDLLSSVSAIRRRMRRSPPPSGITSTQAEVLRLIFYQPELSAAKLASTLHVAPNTISGLLRQLTDLGFIVRRRDPSDLRLAYFDVTPAGQNYVSASRDFRLSVFSAALDGLSEQERVALTEAASALRALAEHLA